MEIFKFYLIEQKLIRNDNELKQQLAESISYSMDQLVEIVISRINGKDIKLFNSFKQKFEGFIFDCLTDEEKLKRLIAAYEQLEADCIFYGVWSDPAQLRTDIQNFIYGITMTYVNIGIGILYEQRLDIYIATIANIMNVTQKKHFLRTSIDELKPKNKKFAEKWYALLHLAYVSIGTKIAFQDNTDRKTIMEYAIKNYELKSTGETFYKTLNDIDLLNLTPFINSLPEKQKRKWKQILLEVSNNDHQIKIWLKKQPN